MIARLPFMLGASLAFGLLAALFIGRALPARPPLVAAQTGVPFHERWQEPPVTPKLVRTIPITPRQKPPPAEPELPPHRNVAPDAPPAPVKAKPKPKRERDATDVCRGKGKRYTNNNRSWRCKR